MITSWDLYWILKLDDLQVLLTICGSAILLLFFCVTAAILPDEEQSKKLLFFTIPVTFLGAFLICVGRLIPSTKQMATILVLPAIVNNEKVQEMGGKTLDIGNDLLDLTKQYLEENIKEHK